MSHTLHRLGHALGYAVGRGPGIADNKSLL